MRYNILIIQILCLLRIAFPQQLLTDKSYHFSFMLPPGWSSQHYDSAHSFIRFECLSQDSSAMVEFYAIKAEKLINLNRFANFATSAEILGKSLGQLQDSTTIRVNKIDGIKKNYKITRRRGAQIEIQAVMLVKDNYGYIIVTRYFMNSKQSNVLIPIFESFNIKLPRSTLSWLFVIALIGICLFGFGLGLFRAFKWFGPLNWRAIAYCSILGFTCLVSIFLIYQFFPKINILLCLIIGGLLVLGITKMPDATPVILAYDKVKKTNTAGTFRAFCQQYESSTRYYNDARKSMNSLMDEVIRKYKNLVAQLDTPIVRAVLAMFEFIKRTDNFQVGVLYNVQNLIKDFTELVKQQRNWSVLPAHPAFSESKNRDREESITKLIRYAFSQITPEDILLFSTVKEPNSNQILFNITYTINVSGMLYYHTSEEGLPDDKKKYYTGVELKWLLEILIPGQREKYQLTLESKPAQQFSTHGNTTDNVYDAMAKSAFDDLSRVFIEQSGLMQVLNKKK